MSSTLFSRPPRRSRSHRVARVGILNESQENRPAPPSPSEREWMCDDYYRYTVKQVNNPLGLCNEIIERNDEIFCDRLKEEINFLMVVAGLFLAIVAAFTVESYKSLREDKQDTMSNLLVEVVRLLNDTNLRGQAKPPKPFMPTHHDIVVNQLWFASMALSLIAVGFGTFCLQWISAFSRGSELTDKTASATESLGLRQLRYEGMIAWGVRHAPEALLLMVQLSIGLFSSGLVYFLWNINHETTIPILVLVSLAAALLAIMNTLPFLQSIAGAIIPTTLTVPHCPYKSPTSWLFLNTGNLFACIIRLFLNQPATKSSETLNKVSQGNSSKTVSRIRTWLESLPLPFTDFRWKKHDLVCVGSRETWISAGSCLQFFGLGLSSALDYLIYDTNEEGIISSCLQHLQPIFPSAREWKMFSQQDLPVEDQDVLDKNYSSLVTDSLPPLWRSGPRRWDYAAKVRVDFLNALILQHLTIHNTKFERILFRHRVELYIRIKNSAQVIELRDPVGKGFSSSLLCPLKHVDDMAELDLELKFQFLSCVKHLIGIRRFTDLDILSAAGIVLLELKSAASAEDQEPGGIPRTDSPTQAEREVRRPDQESVENIPRDQENNPGPSDSENNPEPGLRNHLERGRSEFIGHVSHTEDTQASFRSLCYRVEELLRQLTLEDFRDVGSYLELRKQFRLPPIVPQFAPEEDPFGGVEEV